MADQPTLDQCIAAVRRECAMRGRVYPRLVAEGRLEPENADHETACMRRVLELLEERQPGLFRKPREEGV